VFAYATAVAPCTCKILNATKWYTSFTFTLIINQEFTHMKIGHFLKGLAT